MLDWHRQDYKQLLILLKMYEASENQEPKQSQKYYPSCIREAETQKTIKIMGSIMNKILNLPVRRARIPTQLLHKISSFIFNNPIVLSYPLYQRIDDNVIAYGTFLLYSRQSENTCKLEIKKYWKKLERRDISMDGVMRLAVHFDDCLELKNNPIQLQGQSNSQKWRIISENNHYYHSLFRIMGKYKKDGIINEYVIKAFGEIMSHNILLVLLNHTEQYLIIDSNEYSRKTKPIQIRVEGSQKIGFSFEESALKLISDDYDVYTSTQRVRKRGHQILLDSSNCFQIRLDDIYVR